MDMIRACFNKITDKSYVSNEIKIEIKRERGSPKKDNVT